MSNLSSMTLAIIAARGGSKGIKNKNLLDFCGLPLVAWSVLQARRATTVTHVAVSSECDTILDVASRFGAIPIRRPRELCGDFMSSESAWLHALDFMERDGLTFDRVVALQATSPVRESADIVASLQQFEQEGADSLFSAVEISDFFVWQKTETGQVVAVNYDCQDRKRRQDLPTRYLENGSIYIFRPDLIRSTGNRLGGRISIFTVDKHKMFQIDHPSDVQLCSTLMRAYGYADN